MTSPSRALLLGAVFVVGLSGCGALAGAEDGPPGSAGTQLKAGLVVPEGAQLVGPVFTRWSDIDAAPQATAYLTMDGDLEHVSADLVDQAIALGAGTDAEEEAFTDATTGCDAESLPSVQVCTWGPPPVVPKDWPLAFSLSDQLANADAPSLGTVTWLPDADTPIALPEPVDPGTGVSSVDGGIVHEVPLQIVDGSFLAGPVWPGSVTGGYVAIIGVTGNAGEVFDAYVDQGFDGEPVRVTDRQFGSVMYRKASTSEAGGGYYDVTLNDDGASAWILVERYND
ncbi:MAG TPA: hypothetical protein VMT88_08530 [Actinomycetes bacterium]|nr:hypothetical protein [Actinomycetes bacterium]